MPAYIDYHADLYDLFYSEKDYKGEANFVHSLLRINKSKNILELACGTGSHSIYLAKKGYRILATDNSKDMLRIARKKLSPFENVLVENMNMLRFKKFTKPFDAVICLFDSIGYVQSNENIFKVLTNIHKSLKANGLFIFEFWNAGALLRYYEPKREKTWQIGDKKISRKSETQLMYSNQSADVSYTIHEYRKNELQSAITETQTNRYFLLEEMKFFLSQCGFEVLSFNDGYRNNAKVTENSWHTVCLARKI